MDTIAVRYQAHSFRDLRFEFYSTGRIMIFLGAFSAAPLLFGYALEMALKAGMVKVRSQWSAADRRLVERSHDLAGLYGRARELGLFRDTHIAQDLFQLAADFFRLRYPSSLSKLLVTRDSSALDRAKVFSFDDAVCQLDDSLVTFSNDPAESMGVKALCNIYPSLPLTAAAEAFFHFNPFTLSRLEQYRHGLATSPWRGPDRLQLDVDDLFHRGHARLGYPGWTLEAAGQLLGLELAASFLYPKRGEPDPDPALIFLQRSQRPVLHYADWVLDRLLERFGHYRVSTQEDKEARKIAYVFDRTAQRWWCSLTLVDRSPILATQWVRNASSEAMLEKWINRTERQFSKKRPAV
jgi:hypothetical protein